MNGRILKRQKEIIPVLRFKLCPLGNFILLNLLCDIFFFILLKVVFHDDF